ncbi:hypothetical protein [Streptomyces sp. MP131-18]|uniref:hypothetical protein n=1 Tax=Streptomyces sp. MP131-18 TaxID=1857892 RepID=UPI00097BE022|nr:hypothetical protein [Streptomyces sp. MP131-18]ONK10848.1 hypothetical protein STBA_15730 [Streptomyces sp. MP131-18]
MFGDLWDRAQWQQQSLFLPSGGEVTYEQLKQLRLGSLRQAVEEWAGVRDRLADMAGRARHRMLDQAHHSGWRGVNADVSLPFIEATAGKFEYARQQADALHALLQQLSDALGQSKSELESAAAAAADEGVTVDARGVARTADPPHLSLGEAQAGVGPGVGIGDYGTELSPAQVNALTGVEQRISRALGSAEEAEQTAIRAISDILSERPGEFSPTPYADGADPEAVQTLADVDEFLELSQGDGPVTSDAAVRQLELLNEYADDPLFAERVIDGMGMDAYLQLSQRYDAGAEELDRAGVSLNSLQQGLGTTLITAMQPPGDMASHPPGSAAWNEWLRTPDGQRYQTRLDALQEAGTEWTYQEESASGLPTPERNDARLGYDVVLDLLERGEGQVDDQFFNQLLGGMIDQEKDDPEVWSANRYTGEDGWDQRNDPVDRLLGYGAGNNAEAVTAYFAPVPDGDTSRIDYFLKNPAEEGGRGVHLDGADWTNMALPANAESPGAVAALQVAATGIHPDDVVWPDDQHSDANIAMAEHIWNSFAEDPGTVQHRSGAFAPLLGHIGAEYIADVQHAVAGTGGTLPDDAEAVFDSANSGSLLWEIGKHQEAYERITIANQSLMHVAVDDAVTDWNGDIYSQMALDAAVHRGGYVAGIMTDAHATAMIEDQIAADAAHNAQVDDMAKWVDRGINVAIYGTMTPGMASLTDAIKADAVEAVASTFRVDNSADASDEAQSRFNASRENYQETAVGAFTSAREHNGIDLSDRELTSLEGHIEDAAMNGYNSGTVHQHDS